MANTVVQFPTRSIFTAFQRHWWAAIAALASALGASTLYLIVTPPLYQASARLNVNDKTVSLSSVGETLSDTDEKVGGSDPVAVQAELVKSQGVLSRGLDIYKTETGDTNTPTVKYLQNNIEVRIIPATTLLELIYIGEDPEQVAHLINAVAAATVAENTESIRQQASTLKRFLEGQIPTALAQLAQASKAESQYQNRYSPFPSEVQAKESAQELAVLEQEESSLLASLKDNIARDQRLQKVTGVAEQGTAYTAIQAGQDAELQALESQMTSLKTTIAEARSRLSSQHPEFLNLLDEQKDKSLQPTP
jgi:polysaccharide biosynthesis transport protein